MQTLLVYPNPWAAFDRNGVPCGVCPRDPESDAGGPGRFVGARVDSKNTRVVQDFVAENSQKFHPGLAAKLASQELRSAMQVTRYEYLGIASIDAELAEKLAAKAPIEIPATKFYKERLREGALIPANAFTARKAHVPVFVPPAEYFKSRVLPKGELLPQSPDANGNVLEGPATDAPRVEAASAAVEAGGPAVALSADLTADAAPDAASKSNRSRKSSQETSS